MDCHEFIEHRFAVIRHAAVREFFPSEFDPYEDEQFQLEIDPPWIAHRYDSYIADLIAKQQRRRQRDESYLRKLRRDRAKEDKKRRDWEEKAKSTRVIEGQFCEPVGPCYWALKTPVRHWLLCFRSVQDRIEKALVRQGFEYLEQGYMWHLNWKRTIQFFNDTWDMRMIWVCVGTAGDKNFPGWANPETKVP